MSETRLGTPLLAGSLPKRRRILGAHSWYTDEAVAWSLEQMERWGYDVSPLR